MAAPRKQHVSIWNQLLHFIVHLRWHYQVCILSGGYLLGGYLSPEVIWTEYLLQFLNVHLLLFGGATAYNSWWDKDEGPIGGLQSPPPMEPWMGVAGMILQYVGLFLALMTGFYFALLYALSMILFWFYSSPHFRWKGKPIRSLIAIGISTGTNSALMGYLAAGNIGLRAEAWIASLGVALMVLSLYPVSQIYQIEEDRKRGDVTFAIRFGYNGVLLFFGIAYLAGTVLISYAVTLVSLYIGGTFLIMGTLVGLWIYRKFNQITSKKEDYNTVMRIKYGTSMAFVLLLGILLVLKSLDAVA